jgi:hypothetical protein
MVVSANDVWEEQPALVIWQRGSERGDHSVEVGRGPSPRQQMHLPPKAAAIALLASSSHAARPSGSHTTENAGLRP